MMSIQDNLILDDPDRGIVLPVVKYHTYAQITEDVAYKGRVVPIPESLVCFLKGTEMKVLMLIMSDIRKHAMCYASQPEMGEKLGLTNIAISHATSSLVKLGIVMFDYDKGVKRNSRKKTINFKALERLDNILEDSKPFAAVKLRKRIGNKNIMELTDAQMEWFRTWCKNPIDEIEAEEYN